MSKRFIFGAAFCCTVSFFACKSDAGSSAATASSEGLQLFAGDKALANDYAKLSAEYQSLSLEYKSLMDSLQIASSSDKSGTAQLILERLQLGMKEMSSKVESMTPSEAQMSTVEEPLISLTKASLDSDRSMLKEYKQALEFMRNRISSK